MSSLIPVAIALAAGLLMTRVVKVLHLNFPDVTAFLLAGLAIGPFGLGKLGISGLGCDSLEALDAKGVIPTVALGFSGCAIGN